MASSRNGLIMGKKYVKFIKVCQLQVVQLELHPFLTGCQVDRFDKNWFNPWHLQEVEELLRPVLADCDLSDIKTLKTKDTHKLTQTCLVGPNVRLGIKLKPKMEQQSLLVRSAFSPGYQWSSIQPMKLVAYVCPRLQGNRTSVTTAFSKLLKKRDHSETPDISNYFCPVTTSSSSHQHHITTTRLPSTSRSVRSSRHQDSCAPIPTSHPPSMSTSVKSFLQQDFCAPVPTTALRSTSVCDANGMRSTPTTTTALRSTVCDADDMSSTTTLAWAGSSLSASKDGAHRLCELDSGTLASDGKSAVCGHSGSGCLSTEGFTLSISSGCVLPTFQSSPWCRGVEAMSVDPGPVPSGCVTNPTALTDPTDNPALPNFKSSLIATPNHHLAPATTSNVCCSPLSMSAVYSTAASVSGACPAEPSAQPCTTSLCPQDGVQRRENSGATSTVRHGDKLTDSESEVTPAHRDINSEVELTPTHSSMYIESELCTPAVSARDGDDRPTQGVTKPAVSDFELTQDQDMPTLVKCVDLKPSRKTHTAPVLEPVDIRPTHQPKLTSDPPTLDGPQGSSPWQPLSPVSDDYGLDSWELPDLADPPPILAACSSEPEREEKGLSKTVKDMPVTKTTKKAKPTFRMFSKKQKLSSPMSVDSERSQAVSKLTQSKTNREDVSMSKSVRSSTLTENLAISTSAGPVRQGKEMSLSRSSKFVTRRRKLAPLKPSTTVSNKQSSFTLGQSVSPASRGDVPELSRELVRTGSDHSKSRSPVPLTPPVRPNPHKSNLDKPSIHKPGSGPSKGRSPVPLSPPARHDKPVAKRPFIQLIDIDFTLSSPDPSPRTKKTKYSPIGSPKSHSGIVNNKALSDLKNGQKSSHKHLMNGQKDKCPLVNGQREKKSGKNSEHVTTHTDKSEVLKSNSKLSPLHPNGGRPVASLSSRFALCKKVKNGAKGFQPCEGPASRSKDDKHSNSDTMCSASQSSPEHCSLFSPFSTTSHSHKTGPGKKNKKNKVEDKNSSNETKLREKHAGHKKGASTCGPGHKTNIGHKTSAVNTNSVRCTDFNQTSSSESPGSADEKTSSQKPLQMPSIAKKASQSNSKTACLSANVSSVTSSCDSSSMSTSLSVITSVPSTSSSNKMSHTQPRKPHSPKTSKTLPESPRPPSISKKVMSDAQPKKPHSPKTLLKSPSAPSSMFSSGSTSVLSMSPVAAASQPLYPGPSNVEQEEVANRLSLHQEVVCCGDDESSDSWLPPLDIPFTTDLPDLPSIRGSELSPALECSESPSPRPSPNSLGCPPQCTFKLLSNSASLLHTSSPSNSGKPHSVNSSENKNDQEGKQRGKSSSVSPTNSPANSRKRPSPTSPKNNKDGAHKQRRKSPSSSSPASNLSNRHKRCSSSSPENKRDGDRDEKRMKKAPRERSPLSSLPTYNSSADAHKFVSENRSMSSVSDQQLVKLVLKYRQDLKAIAAGSLHCDRHAQYMKGGLARRALDHASNLKYFGSGQEDAVMDTLMSLFPSHQVKDMDYMLRVLLPEVLERIYTHVTGLSLS